MERTKANTNVLIFKLDYLTNFLHAGPPNPLMHTFQGFSFSGLNRKFEDDICGFTILFWAEHGSDF